MLEDEVWDYLMKRAEGEISARRAMRASLASAEWADENRQTLHKTTLRQAFEAGYQAALERTETR